MKSIIILALLLVSSQSFAQNCVTIVEQAKPIDINTGAFFTNVRFADPIQSDDLNGRLANEALNAEIGLVKVNDLKTNYLSVIFMLEHNLASIGPGLNFLGGYLSGSCSVQDGLTIYTFRSTFSWTANHTEISESVITVDDSGFLKSIQFTYPERKLVQEGPGLFRSYFQGKNHTTCVSYMLQK